MVTEPGTPMKHSLTAVRLLIDLVLLEMIDCEENQ